MYGYCVTLHGRINSAGMHFILSKVPASRKVYLTTKLRKCAHGCLVAGQNGAREHNSLVTQIM